MAISNRIANCDRTVSFPEFVSCLEKGQTYGPVFSGSRRKGADWQQQSVFVADIDTGNRPLREILGKSKTFDLPVAIVHETFSSNENCRKWRVICISGLAGAFEQKGTVSLKTLLHNSFRAS